MLPLAAGAAVTIGSFAGSALGQTYTWTSTAANGNFSDTTKWQGGLVPPTNDPATALVFTTGNAAASSAWNDIGPFVLNSLSFNVNNALTLHAGANPSYVLHLQGASPSISMSGLGTVALVPGAGAIQLSSNLNINVAGPGNITFSDAISDDLATSGIQRSLTISGSNPLRAWSLAGLWAGNSFSGGLILDGGALTTTNPGVATTFGPNGSTLTVTANGGMIASNGALNSSLGVLQLNGPLYFVGASVTFSGAGTLAGVLQGSGPLYADTALTFNGDSGSDAFSPYTGAVIADQSSLPNMATTFGGALTLGGQVNSPGPNGSMNTASSFDIRAGGQLILNNNVQNSFQNGDKIGDTVPVRLRSGGLTLYGPAVVGAFDFVPTDLTEMFGVLSGAGNNTVTAVPTPSTGVASTLQADSLSRVERGTFIFRGTALGDGSQPERGQVTLTHPLAGSAFVGGGGAAGSQNISILPYAAGNSNASDNGTSLVTYGANGFRPLTNSEYYSADLTPSDPTVNVRITNDIPNSGTTTMNALVLANDGGSNDATVSGAGTLNITSGVIIANPAMILSPPFPVSFTNNVAFGSAEGIIYTVGTRGLTISGNLSGSNGLTRTGNGTSAAAPNNVNTDVLILTGDNHLLTGPLTIDAGLLEFNSANALPGTGTIVANGSNIASNFVVNASSPGAVLSYVGSSPLTISRSIAVNTGYFSIKQLDYAGTGQPPIGNLTVAGQITGAGGMNYYAQNAASPNGEIYVTNTANTYTGPTRFGAGTVHIAGDGATGVGGGWDFTGTTLTLEGNVTNNRYVNLEGATTFNTNGHNMTLNGPMTSLVAGNVTTVSSGGGFTKTGAGTLTLTSPINLLAGNVTVSAGTLIVNGNLGPSTNAPGLTVAAGATLGGSGNIYRNVSVSGTLSPGNSPGTLTIWGGNPAPPSSPGTALALGSGATMRMELNGPAAGTGYDQVVVNTSATSGATVALGAGVAALNISLGYAPTGAEKFWLINNTSAGTTTGNFAGLAEGATVTLGTFNGFTYTGTISYKGDFATNNPAAGTGNDVVIYNLVGPPKCGSADFNCDGDIGTDADIEAFFACLAGVCPPPPCTNSADFNGDGDIGTDADIEAFFRVLAGGTC
jgi:autotransporter-associated beta strand protein